ncbi:MAG: molecular chaperone HtpG, partial [Neisseriaceae bacterium]|nr:molecular chaperone HtpG [Neisseriaceae bacterium]
WKTFGATLKEGIGEDMPNKERIAKLCRFATSTNGSEEQSVTLPEYVARMKDGQDKIYYITADNYAAAKDSPHLEIFAKKGIEVLLLTDRVDEWVVGNLDEFDGKKLVSVAKGALDLGNTTSEEEKAEQKQAEESGKTAVERIKAVLGEKVAEVRATARLTESPACLVVGENQMSRHLTQMLEAAGAAHRLADDKPILEINPQHRLICQIAAENNEERRKDLVELVFDQAVLAEGGKIENPAVFVKRLNRLLAELG